MTTRREWRATGVQAMVVAAMLVATHGCAGQEVPSEWHLIYLHGRIVQQEQSARPHHPQFGFYELEEILDTFRERGFVVHGQIRPRSATWASAADEITLEVRELLDSGIPADQIMIVGGSMGGAIALVAATRLQNLDIRVAVLGACLGESVRGLLAEEGAGPLGHVLSIREASDDLTASCATWEDGPESPRGLDGKEIVLETGLGHGFLYRPLPEWVDPVIEWTGGRVLE